MSPKLETLRRKLSSHLVAIEELLADCGLSSMADNITLIMRDPANDEMFLCVTSEDDDGLVTATELAINGNEEP